MEVAANSKLTGIARPRKLDGEQQAHFNCHKLLAAPGRSKSVDIRAFGRTHDECVIVPDEVIQQTGWLDKGISMSTVYRF